MRRKSFIPLPLYRKILGVIPIPCVDAVILHGERFLLGKRNNKPARGTWYLIGGRVLKGESLSRAVIRKVREETGLRDLQVKKFVTTEATLFRKGAQDCSVHTINSVFVVTTKSDRFLSQREHNSELRWFSRIDKRWPAYVKKALRLAGFS